MKRTSYVMGLVLFALRCARSRGGARRPLDARHSRLEQADDGARICQAPCDRPLEPSVYRVAGEGIRSSNEFRIPSRSDRAEGHRRETERRLRRGHRPHVAERSFSRRWSPMSMLAAASTMTSSFTDWGVALLMDGSAIAPRRKHRLRRLRALLAHDEPALACARSRRRPSRHRSSRHRAARSPCRSSRARDVLTPAHQRVPTGNSLPYLRFALLREIDDELRHLHHGPREVSWPSDVTSKSGAEFM